jgi:hypothetical protein
MQLEQLCSALEAASPAPGVRRPFVFGVRFPLWPLLRKELAEFYIAMGFVGEWCAACMQLRCVREGCKGVARQ